MNALRRKMLSDRGASITFALLLFLVCAVASSIIIVSSTASAGRMADLAEMDQRYYAVTSAAALLRDVMSGDDAVTVKKDGTVESTSKTLKEDASELVVKALNPRTSFPRTFQRTFQLTQTALPTANLNCTIAEKVEPNGLASFDISCGDATAGIYTLRIVFSSNTKRNNPSTDSETTTVTWKLHSVSKVRKTSPVGGGGTP